MPNKAIMRAKQNRAASLGQSSRLYKLGKTGALVAGGQGFGSKNPSFGSLITLQSTKQVRMKRVASGSPHNPSLPVQECGNPGIVFIADVKNPNDDDPSAPTYIAGLLPSGIAPNGDAIGKRLQPENEPIYYKNIGGYVNVRFTGMSANTYQTLIIAKDGLSGKKIKICKNGKIIKKIKIGLKVDLYESIAGYHFYVPSDAKNIPYAIYNSAFNIIRGEKYTIIME